jgi:alpha-1,2-mannosyltransferase
VTRKIQNLRGLRPEGLSLLIVMWASALWTVWTAGALDRFGALKGTDFAQFYVAARLVVTGRIAQLYDWSVFAHELAAAVPGPEGLLYLSIYPPQLALLLAPLGALSYLHALLVWTVLSAAAYVVSGLLVIRGVAPLRADLALSLLLLVSFPAFPQLLLFGQVSALALVLVTVAWMAWRGGRELAAGILLGALVFKPQMLAIAVAAGLLLPGWRIAAGAAMGAVLELALTVAIGGWAVVSGYASSVQHVLRNPAAFEPKAEQLQGLRGLLTSLGDGTAGLVAFLALTGLVFFVAVRALRRIDSQDLRFAVVVITGALVNPHLYVYDLVVLVMPLGVIAGWLVEESLQGRRHVGAAAATRLLYWLPLVAPVLGLLKLQFTAPVMLWLLWELGAGVRRRSTVSPQTVSSSHPRQADVPSATPEAAPRS